MRPVLLATPGVSKGIQDRRIVVHGGLTLDETVLDVLRSVVLEAVRIGGYVLDGFPRTLPQTQTAHRGVRNIGAGAGAVVHLHAAEADLVRRLLVRVEWESRADNTDRRRP